MSCSNICRAEPSLICPMHGCRASASTDKALVMVDSNEFRRTQAGPQCINFPFQNLPVELRAMIIESCGSGFFSADIGRLAVSKEWYAFAVPTLYRGLTLTQVTYCAAHIERIAPLCAVPEIQKLISERLQRYLRTADFQFDRLLRRHVYSPGDHDREHANPDIDERRKVANFHLNSSYDNDWLGEEGLRFDFDTPEETLNAHSVAFQQFFLDKTWNNIDTFVITLRQAWGLHRRVVHVFESHLCYALRPEAVSHSNLSDLRLDLPGLARRGTAWSHQHFWQFHCTEPLFWLHHVYGVGECDNDEKVVDVDSWTFRTPGSRHLCLAAQEALPFLEVLHFRTRSMCKSLFRNWEHEKRAWIKKRYPGLPDEFLEQRPVMDWGEDLGPNVDSPLPKLRELVVNMVLPRWKFMNPRVVHCDTFDCNLTPEAGNVWADIALDEMKVELARFVKRLPNAEKVVLMYSIHRPNGKLTHFEFDVLANETRIIMVDRWGEFLCHINSERTYTQDECVSVYPAATCTDEEEGRRAAAALRNDSI